MWSRTLRWLLAPVLSMVQLACSAEKTAFEARSPDEPLRIALHAEPSVLDPHLQSEYVAQAILGNVVQGLVEFDANMAPQPALAVRWQNPDDYVWRFFLRSGILFHDGTILDAWDVEASLERARFHPESRTAGHLVAVEDVRVVDELTIEIVTKEPYPILLNKLPFLGIVPAEAPVRIERPIGTGPYRYVGREENGDHRLEVWEKFWREAPESPVALYGVESDAEARGRQLAEGQWDLVMDPGPEGWDALRGVEGIELLSRTGLVVSYLQMHLGIPPFDDPRVREAIDLSIDREALVKAEIGGRGVVVSQMVSPSVFGYDPELPLPERDLERARELLAEAGWEDGLDLRLELREGRSAKPIVEQLAEAGIRVEVVPTPWSTMYERLVGGQVGFYLGGWACTSGDASDVLDQKVHSPQPERGYGESASAGIRDPELDRIVEASGRLLKMNERRTLLQEALRRVARDRALVGLFVWDDLYAARSDLRWRPRQDGRIYAWEMAR